MQELVNKIIQSGVVFLTTLTNSSYYPTVLLAVSIGRYTFLKAIKRRLLFAPHLPCMSLTECHSALQCPHHSPEANVKFLVCPSVFGWCNRVFPRIGHPCTSSESDVWTANDLFSEAASWQMCFVSKTGLWSPHEQGWYSPGPKQDFQFAKLACASHSPTCTLFF